MSALNNSEWGDASQFPQNLTLYVDQFNGDGSQNSQDRVVIQAGNINKAFQYYKPQMDIVLQNEEGESVIEHFEFCSVDDFEDDPLIAQSELLSLTAQKIDTCNNYIHHLERNKELHNAIVNGVDCNSYFKDDLNLWNAIVKAGGTDPRKAIDACFTIRNEAEANLQNNLAVIHEETHQLEVSYLTLETFFDNVGLGDTDCLTLMNLKKDLCSSSKSEGITIVQNELKKHYDALSLKNSFSLLVVPGYLGDASSLRKWAELAYRNKVLLVTDFNDCQSFKLLKEELEDAHFQDSDVKMSNVIMTCNYILGRKKSELSNEYDDVFIPGSGALAGRLANIKETNIAQGIVGKDHGFLNNVKGTRLSLLKSELSLLIAQGVIPLADFNGQTYALSNRSLYNGVTVSLQEYPIVRVLDWVNKVLMNYMHDIALETWDTYVSPQKLENKIREFLEYCRSYQLLFSNYKLAQPKQDPVTNIVTVDVSVTPFYSTKNLNITLEADNKDHLEANTSIE